MKHFVLFLFVIGLAFSQFGCSSDPEDPPRFRIRNDRTTKANVQIKTSGGNTININDVQAGQTSGYQEAAAGQIEATAVIQGEAVSPTVTFNASTNATYTVVVANATPPTLNVISP
jgi:hypothetical protein